MKTDWSQGLCPSETPPGNLFLDSDWLEAFAKHLANRNSNILTMQQGQLSLPFALQKETVRHVPSAVLRVLGDPLADQCWFRLDAGWSWSSAAASLSLQTGWDIAVLSELHCNEVERGKIDEALLSAGLKGHWRQCGRAPVVTFDAKNPMSEADYSSTLRRRLKRARKKLEAAGEVSVTRTCPTPGDVDEMLEILKIIEDGSWKGDAETGLFSDERLPFVRDLTKRLAALGQIEIYVMTLDGKPISYRYGFRYDNRFLDYNLAYLKEYHHLSPGRILLDEIVKTSQSLGLEAVDASRGSMERPHILVDWPGHVRYHHRLTVYAPTAKGRLLHSIETRVRPLALRMRQKLKRDKE